MHHNIYLVGIVFNPFFHSCSNLSVISVCIKLWEKTIEKGLVRTPTWTFFNYILFINTCPNEPLRKISLRFLFGNSYIFNVGFLPDVSSILMYTKYLYLAHLFPVKENDVFIGIYFIPIRSWRDISILFKMAYHGRNYMQYEN